MSLARGPSEPWNVARRTCAVLKYQDLAHPGRRLEHLMLWHDNTVSFFRRARLLDCDSCMVVS